VVNGALSVTIDGTSMALGASAFRDHAVALVPFLEVAMTYGESRVYKKVEVIGTSPNSVDDAIQKAVDRASESLEKISWFEVQEVRGHVNDDGKVGEYQVILKIAFELS
jgi:flavin-binding protein dodecin